jgi:Copper type II ascorbate-dependent monooxygenase, C-terminal domain
VARCISNRARMFGAVLSLVGAVLGACAEEGAGGSSELRGDAGDSAASAKLPCAVQQALQAKCQSCHADPPLYGAYMPLTTQAHFQAAGTGDASKKVFELAKTRINAATGAMPPVTSPQLSSEELAALNAWLDQGAPASGTQCGEPPVDAGITTDSGADTSNLDCYKLLARGDDLQPPYRVGVAVDKYMNVRFAAPWQGTAYGVLMRPVIDNEQVIHHWLLFQDAAPGAPTGAVKSNGAHPGGQLVSGWAPGGAPVDLRASGVDVGLELPGDTTYTVEFHYNSTDAAATDASGVEICVSKTRPANIAALSWLGHDNLATAGDNGGPRNTWTGTCAHKSQQPVHILSVWPHMHLQGRHMKATIKRANGALETLHDEAFDFNYQVMYPKRVTLMPGETITTECSYAQPMSFGQGTSAEMCYLFTMAYPRGALVDDGWWGSVAHGNSACLGQ